MAKLIVNAKRASVAKNAKKNGKNKNAGKKAVKSLDGKAVWYNGHNGEAMEAARLFNVRKTDCVHADGKKISKGTIIEGTYGFAMAEHDVQNTALKDGKAVSFKANSVISWRGKEYRAMVHKDGASNYCVAQTTGAGGRLVLFNAEIEKGASYRQKDKRASLVKML